MKTPASGSMKKIAKLDITVDNRVKDLQFAIEVKTTLKERLHIIINSVNQLINNSQRLDSQPIFLLKVKGKRRSWTLLYPEQLSSTPSPNDKITFRDALQIDIDFKTIIKEEE